MAMNYVGTTLSSDRRGAESWIKLDDTDKANTFQFVLIGGSRTVAIPTGGGYQDGHDYLDFEIPDSASSGGTWKVVCEMRTENATTTVTPKLRNTTDASDTWTGSAATSTSWGTKQTSTSLSLSSGKTYRIQFSKSDDNYQAWGIAWLRRTSS